MLSTMQDGPLLVGGILRHGQQVYGDSLVRTIVDADGGSIDATFAQVAERAERLAKALTRLGWDVNYKGTVGRGEIFIPRSVSSRWPSTPTAITP